jgi:hypothetical protein
MWLVTLRPRDLDFSRRPCGSHDDSDICSGVLCSSVHKDEISLPANGTFCAGFTYDAYCEVADSDSVMALLSERNTANASWMSLASARGCSRAAK